MSADRVRCVPDYADQLTKLGCKKLSDIDEYNELWISSGDFPFTVPKLGEGCPESMWPDVVADAYRSK